MSRRRAGAVQEIGGATTRASHTLGPHRPVEITKDFVNHSDLLAKAPSLAAGMAAAEHNPDTQLSQTRHRAALVASWHIAPGSTVLELGCGQGDMTAVLAEAVGPKGRVVAVDVAAPSYGAPVTLGESAARLAAGPLGPRIDFRFATDVLDPSVDFPESTFDHVVFAHCSWYFTSLGHLRDTLARVRPWARRLWFTEWDLTPTSDDQLAHLLAVLIQGQIEAAGSHGQGNVRTPFSREACCGSCPRPLDGRRQRAGRYRRTAGRRLGNRSLPRPGGNR